MGAEKFACIPQNNEKPSVLVFLNVFRRFPSPLPAAAAALKTTFGTTNKESDWLL
jgi:hypothetical protein